MATRYSPQLFQSVLLKSGNEVPVDNGSIDRNQVGKVHDTGSVRSHNGKLEGKNRSEMRIVSPVVGKLAKRAGPSRKGAVLDAMEVCPVYELAQKGLAGVDPSIESSGGRTDGSKIRQGRQLV